MSDSRSVTIHGVSPYLYYADAGAALDWLARVFGFGESVRYLDGDGTVREAEIAVGDTRVMMTGQAPGPDDGPGQLLIVHLDDVDAHYACTVAAGVEAEPPKDESYGPRTYHVTDPWGYKWYFWQQVRPYTESEGGLKEVRV